MTQPSHFCKEIDCLLEKKSKDINKLLIGSTLEKKLNRSH